MSFRLDHIQLAIPEGGEAAAREFWCQRLGLDEIEKPEALRANGGLWLSLSGCELHIGIDPDFRPARKAHPAFIVGDLSTVAAGLPGPIKWDNKLQKPRFFCEDPFGNRLEFMEG